MSGTAAEVPGEAPQPLTDRYGLAGSSAQAGQSARAGLSELDGSCSCGLDWRRGPRALFVRSVWALPLLAALVVAGGCATFGYYAQAVGGQVELTRSSRRVDALLADPRTPPELRERLLLAGEIVRFSRSELDLDGGGSYRTYAALDRPYVVWNLFAAPPLSLDGRRWCYPVAGCVPYRGFFKRRSAERAAARLAADGFETHVAGVPAYSTLGWFNDPLLSTFIDWPEARFVELLIHETAHRRIWARNDAVFNESFAEYAGETGTRLWFAAGGQDAEYAAYQADRKAWRRMKRLLLRARDRLAEVYRGDGDDALRLREKARVLDAFRRCYRDHRPRLGGGSFDTLADGVNNAYLVALGAYADWRPAFAALYRQSGDWFGFLEAVDALAALGADERAAALRRLQLDANPAREERVRIECGF